MFKFIKSHAPYIIVIAVVVIFLTRNLWGTRAWIETHDGIYHLVRQEVFSGALKRGNFPVRWAGTLDNGFGLPLFNYVYPGPYYLGAPLSLIGVNSRWVIKFVEITLYLLGGIGMYFLFAKKHKLYATVTSILYLTTPYLMLNIFIRGALGEVMAISCMPWILLVLNDLRTRKKLHWYHPIPYFLMFIAHNFLSLLFLPIYFIIIYFNFRKIWRVILKNFLLSLGLASFFFIPMLIEQKYLYSVVISDFTYNYLNHFVYPIQLIIGKWGNGFSYPGINNDGFSVALGFTSMVILGVGIISSIRKRNKDIFIWLVLTGLIVFFLLPVSAIYWRMIPPLQMIQFPWRLLSFTILTIPMIAFYLLASFKKTNKLYLTIGILLLVSLYFGFKYSTPFYFQNNDQVSQQLYLDRNRTTTSSRLEILPKWGSVETRYIGEENIRVAHGSAEISNLILTPEKLTFTADTKDDGAVFRIRRNYFPSWFARDESGNMIATRSTDDGLIDFTGRSGIHTYTVYVGSTKIELLGNIISLITLLFLIILELRPKLKKYIDDHFENWDISIALRYLPIADELKRLARSSERILEIGSEITGITTYLKRRITGLDQGFDYSKQNRYLKPVVGSATKIPFKDRSFEYVISVDCLEHIPAHLRVKAVEEMLRVASKRVYLSFPVGSQSETIDRLLDKYFFRRNGAHFSYLEEHVKNGLPTLDYIPKLLAKHPELSYTVSGNTSNWLWTILLKMGLSNIPWQTSLYRRLLLLLPILKHCNFAPTYRQLYIITMTKS